jgi:hypothetical protein
MFSLKIPKMMCVPITDKCHLRCGFCYNSNDYFKTAKHMDIDEFKDIVDWLISEGISYIDITPAVGEALLIPNLHEFLDYLDNSSIDKYLLITSLAVKDISVLKDRHKIDIEVSLYGENAEQYIKTTGRDVFDLVLPNIKELTKDGITILKRFKEPITSTDLRLITKFDNVKLVDYSDDRGLEYASKTGEVRECVFMKEPLVTKRGISLCCKDHKIEDLVIGQVGESLKDIYNNISIDDVKCSIECDWFIDASTD